MFFSGILSAWKISEKQQVQDHFQIPAVISKQKVRFLCENVFLVLERKIISLSKSRPAECCAGPVGMILFFKLLCIFNHACIVPSSAWLCVSSGLYLLLGGRSSIFL